MKLQLAKIQAERAFRQLIGSAAGMEVWQPGFEYAVSRGITCYKIHPADMWPDGTMIRCEIIFGGKTIKTIYVERDTYKLNWKVTDLEERRIQRERRAVNGDQHE